MTSTDNFRRTKIVATLGPSSNREDVVAKMIDAGVNVFRVNSSHGTPEMRAGIMDMVRAVRDRRKTPVGLLVDLQGPRIRVGTLDAPVELTVDDEVIFAHESIASGDEIPTTYESLALDVQAGDRMLLADGLMEVRVVDSDRRKVTARVVAGGELASNKGINLPGVQVSAPSVTDKDKEDIDLALDHGADFIGLSFVRRAEEIWAARGLVPENIRLIAKIELAAAMESLDGIVEAADALMVARGDLGVELPFEEVPLAQKKVILQANRLGRPVITATQMLESMVENPRPTRAEASDVANAVLDGTDAVMLSAETAIGTRPVETVEAMARIVERVERSTLTTMLSRRRRMDRQFDTDRPTVADAIAMATVVAANMLELPLIVCLTSSGFTARQIAAARPTRPIIGLTPERRTFHQLALTWGVRPFLASRQPTYEKMLGVARDSLVNAGLAKAGDQLVVTAGVPFDVPGTTNLVKVEVV